MLTHNSHPRYVMITAVETEHATLSFSISLHRRHCPVDLTIGPHPFSTGPHTLHAVITFLRSLSLPPPFPFPLARVPRPPLSHLPSQRPFPLTPRRLADSNALGLQTPPTLPSATAPHPPHQILHTFPFPPGRASVFRPSSPPPTAPTWQ